MDLFPFSAALNFNCLSIDKEESFVLFPICDWYFFPNWSGSSVSEAGHFHDDVRQPCLYFKYSEGVFPQPCGKHSICVGKSVRIICFSFFCWLFFMTSFGLIFRLTKFWKPVTRLLRTLKWHCRRTRVNCRQNWWVPFSAGFIERLW